MFNGIRERIWNEEAPKLQSGVALLTLYEGLFGSVPTLRPRGDFMPEIRIKLASRDKHWIKERLDMDSIIVYGSEAGEFAGKPKYDRWDSVLEKIEDLLTDAFLLGRGLGEKKEK